MKLVEKCPTCGKLATEESRKEVSTSNGNKLFITLACKHFIIRDAQTTSRFETFTFDGDKDCNHVWGEGKERTRCKTCDAKRLYEYQVIGAQELERHNGRFGVFDEQGLGKTIQALAFLHFNRATHYPFIWVTKSKIKYQHAHEIVRLLGYDSFPQVITTGGNFSPIPGMNIIASYDIFKRLNNLTTVFKEHGVKTIVLDECQAIANGDSARTNSLRTIIRDIPHIIPLSGTPWKNKAEEFFTILNILDPVRFHNKKQFIRDWVYTYWQHNKPISGGIGDPERFKTYCKDLFIRRERKDVMPELPLISRNKLLCTIPEHARKAYQKEEEQLAKIFNEAVIDGRENTFAVQQAMNANLMVMRQIVGIAKVDSTVEFAEEFLEETDRKLAIFVHHIECGNLIFDRLEKFCREKGLPKPLRFAGGTSSEDSYAIQKQFNDAKQIVLVASTLSSGEGLNLQTGSDCIIHERQWNPANEEQVEGRFVRIGQEANAVTATYVHADDSCDIEMDGIVSRKRLAFHTSHNTGEVPKWDEQAIKQELFAKIAQKYRGRK